MTTRLSLHIGVNSIDPDAYGTDGRLAAAEADARSFKDVAAQCGFDATQLLTERATRASVLHALAEAADRLTAGDYFFLTYSGHGGHVPADGSEMLDETWCLYDTQLVDDELYAAIESFASGVRVVMLSDGCHAGSMPRELVEPNVPKIEGIARRLPIPATFREFRRNTDRYGARTSRREASFLMDPKADVVLLAGCRHDQLSLDGVANGEFTEAFLDAWDYGDFAGTFTDLRDRVREHLPPTQIPQLLAYGPTVDELTTQTPLAL